ncbi:expressed unknown protein [Seminavis robusta]|uniref:Uncharacterized protein n=1 Tax=Seminavis robusta TaxID=568900 RepID=A0A9N8H5S3_9STRA|nr:expressed unknown protein [Seminavis robusta]|eukprot:Sro81_g043591.1  (190) ;mRNA; f:111839-112408
MFSILIFCFGPWDRLLLLAPVCQVEVCRPLSWQIQKIAFLIPCIRIRSGAILKKEDSHSFRIGRHANLTLICCFRNGAMRADPLPPPLGCDSHLCKEAVPPPHSLLHQVLMSSLFFISGILLWGNQHLVSVHNLQDVIHGGEVSRPLLRNKLLHMVEALALHIVAGLVQMTTDLLPPKDVELFAIPLNP